MKERRLMRVRNKAHIFLAAYERMNSIFESKFGYSLYFIGGTLLGYIREKDFLEHDKDMDISYFSRYTNVSDVKKEILEIIDALIASGEKLYFVRSDYSLVKNYFRWRVDERDRIDVMPTWSQNGIVYRPTFVGYQGSREIILPLKKEKFYGHDIYIPNKPEIKLANVYGDDWRIPNKGFKKKTRKSDQTVEVVSNQLSFGSEIWKLIKKTEQWKNFSILEKIFLFFFSLRRFKVLTKYLPDRKLYKHSFLKNLVKKIKKTRNK